MELKKTGKNGKYEGLKCFIIWNIWILLNILFKKLLLNLSTLFFVLLLYTVIPLITLLIIPLIFKDILTIPGIRKTMFVGQILYCA